MLTLLISLSAQLGVLPLDATNSFPFVIPWNDGLRGTATDVSFLNAKPAGKNGFIVAKNGHFVESKTGKRIRFFGTNVVAEGAFPSHADADRMAAHMAKMGINLVRFHHMNNGWAVDTGGSIWKRGRAHVEIDPAQLDKMDYFVAALKKQGIYSNINLQVSREYVPELGLPESVRQIPNFQKKIDKVNERMIRLQMAYARDLLDRKNPYTGLKYNADPAVAKVEINNENSLVGWPGESAGAGLNGFPEPFRTEIQGRWNGWLKKTYGTDAGLRRAWPKTADELGSSVLKGDSTWTYENQSNADVKFAMPEAKGVALSAPALTVTVNGNNGPDWHVQSHINGLTLKSGKFYTVSFEAKGDRAMSVGLNARIGRPDWHGIGLDASASVGTEWQPYHFSFRASATEDAANRIGFVLGGVRGTLEVRNFTLREGLYDPGLGEGESLERGTIAIPSPSFTPRFRDWTRFVAETERAYSVRMRNFLRNELGFKRTNLIDTQASWGGLTTLYREAEMEFADNHAYWNHPVFLGGDWDPKNYRVDRRALVEGLPSNAGTMADLARYRVEGKPYSVSEYNHPAPSDYQVEMMPVYATFAGFQDWDAIYTFDYGYAATGRDNSVYNGYFEMVRNPAKMAFFPATALIFRLGLVPPAPVRRTLIAPARPWEAAMTPGEAWSQIGVSPDPMKERVSMMRDPKAQAGVRSQTSRGRGPGAIRTIGNSDARGYFAESPSSLAMTGFLGGKSWNAQVGTFRFDALPTRFASLMLAPLDGKALRNSKRMLLTLGARVENENMDWNAERTSVSDRWGRGPVRAERVGVSVRLKVDGPRKVYALDPTGKRKTAVSAKFSQGALTFSTKGQNSMWFEIAR
jgi:hypothetical protein